MIIRAFCLAFMYFSFANGILAQGHQELLKILGAELPFDQKKRQIETFMQENQGKLSKLELAECYHDIGSKWHKNNFNRSGDFTELLKAITMTEKSLLLKRQLPLSEQCTINRSLFNLGLDHSHNDNFPAALEYFMEIIRKGTQYCPSGGAEKLIELTYHEIGDLYIDIGDFYKALDVYENLISEYKTQNVHANNAIIWAYIRLAEIYTAIDLKGNSKLVKSNLEKALDSLEKSKISCCFFENRIFQLEGNRLSEIGKFRDAIGYYGNVISNLDEADSVNLASTYNSLGLAHFEFGEKGIAEEILQKAILFNMEYDAPFNNLGDLYLSNRQYKRALGSYQTAIDLSINKNIDLQYNQLPTKEQLGNAANKMELLNHIVIKANAWISYYEYDKNQNHLRHALRTFSLADQLVDLIRDVSNEQKSKLYWREQSSSLYMKAVEVCHLLNKIEEAFHFMERNKALLLLEDLTHEEAKDIAQIPQNLAQREFKLKRSIFLAENVLFESGNIDQGSNDSLKTLINDNKYEYQKFIDSLNIAFPDYAKFKKKATILSYGELMSAYVSDQQAVLHYILNEDDGYGLFTSEDGPILFQLEETVQLSTKIDTLISMLARGISDMSTFKTTSHALFKKLIPEDVFNKIRDKRLIIIPDFTLQRIPFETLVVDVAKTKYLVEGVEISYVYSMSMLDHNLGKVRNQTKQLLSFAPVNFDKLGLVELRNSESEVSNIAPLFETDIFLNDKASKANFLKEVGAPKIIHLATHADMGDGENPWIAFSDEKMYLKEIYAIKNQSEMVVLSACNTLNGDLKRGEGVMSLARGFFYSGAKSVVSSLWPITDEAGSDVMVSFYQNLKKGQSKSKALRQAKLNYLNGNIVEELKHPFYWAGFVLVGDNTPLVTSPNPVWFYVGILLVILILYSLGRNLLKRFQ